MHNTVEQSLIFNFMLVNLCRNREDNLPENTIMIITPCYLPTNHKKSLH